MQNIFLKIITEKGLYILLAVIGLLSGLTTMFIDINTEISIKWLLFTISISLTILILFFSFLNKIVWEKQIASVITIIKVIEEKNTLVLKTNQNISINSILTVYIDNDKFEDLYCACVIENIQANGLLSAKIIKMLSEKNHEVLLKRGIVKTTLPITILEGINV